MINLTILSENRDNNEFKGESGLSVLVDAFGQQFLLDTGYSDLFLKNAQLLGINLDDIKTVVLTHGHSDHTNGVPFLKDGKLIITHEESFKYRFSKRKRIPVGFPLSKEELCSRHDVTLSRKPVQFLNGCYFLGEIPMTIDFEKDGNFSTTLDDEMTMIDFTEDDSGIAITTDKGLFIMTGCGHRGVCNTIEHAKNVTGQNKIWGVFGGFHLRNLEKQKDIIDQTIQYFIDNEIQCLCLGHCVTDEVIDYFEQNLPNTQIIRLAAGKNIQFEVCPYKEKQMM